MVDELRQAIIPGLERIAQDITTGSYGDPYVAVAVLIYADREPTVHIIHDGDPAHDLTRTRAAVTTEPAVPVQQRFPSSELEEAGRAILDGLLALRVWTAKDGEPGDCVRRKIRTYWESRRDDSTERALAAAAEAHTRPEVCPHCKDRFTTRGIKMHLARSWWCSKQEAKQREAAD